jgi:hypothetical protein
MTRKHTSVSAYVGRRLLGGLFLVTLILIIPSDHFPHAASAQAPPPNPIFLENQQPGSGDWFFTKMGDDGTGQIKGYASAASVKQNESLTFQVTVNPAQTYSIDFYRMGWYGGLGARRRLQVGPLAGVQQPPCDSDPNTGLMTCNWAPSYTLTVPSDWTTGIYLARLTNEQGYQNYVPFVVRDGRPATFLYQQSVATEQAYNGYPNDGRTGKSLYTFNSSGFVAATKVSFDRPLHDSGIGGVFMNWEINFLRWIERSGYDVTYTTDLDTHTNGSELLNHRAFLVAGHSEYWSKEMFDAAEAARDAGVNLAFFGANNVYTQVRFEPSPVGGANRVMVCYRSYPWTPTDPVQGPTTTTEFRQPPVSRPEQSLIGIQYTSTLPNTDYVVTNSGHWVYAGTGFQEGDVVPGILGYEVDALMPDFSPPNSANQALLSRSPYVDNNGVSKFANSSIYQAPSGAWVFGAGTISWSWALDDVPGPFSHRRVHPKIQQTTTNILNAFLNGTNPTIASFAPTSGPVGTSVTISGTNLTGATSVTFNGTAASFTVTSATAIQATVPVGATTGPLSVTTPEGTATGASPFTVTTSNAPEITSFTPTSGLVGTRVTIAGANFTGATAVRFNGIVAGVAVTSATEIETTVPAGATTGPLSVTTPQGTATSATLFTVPSPPTITSFTPTSGAAGRSVTISGTSFTGATAVTFNGSPATFLVVSDTAIQTTAPAGVTTGPLTVTTTAGTATSATAFTSSSANPIVLENQQPGSGDWLWTKMGDDATRQIKGYASATSVKQNENITFKVTVNPAQTFTINFYRMGWYDGLGARLRLQVGPLTGVQQPACDTEPNTGQITCNWAPSYTLTVPSDWTTGIYLARLTNEQGFQNYVPFVVRDGRPAAFLYQQSVATEQAYNNYPNDGLTGKSFYDFSSYGAITASGNKSAVKVSFDRPLNDTGIGAAFRMWEINFLRWMEKSGYDVTYTTDLDTHANGGELLNHRAFLLAGHGEYWSKAMFDAAEAARDAGVNLGFFGANNIYTQVRFEPSPVGGANRVMVCYRSYPWAPTDPVQGPTTTTEFRVAPVSRPEQSLIGIQYTNSVPHGNYVVTNSGHWVYAGTGFSDGDAVPGILGNQVDALMPNYPSPNSANQTLLSHSPFTQGGVTKYATSSIYRAPSGAWVFGAGTISWSWALDDVPGPFRHQRLDTRIQHATANILNAFLTGVPPTISGFTPTSGSVGSGVAISGTSLTGATAVRFGGTAASFSVLSDTTIQATVPEGATTGPLSVTTPAGAATSAAPFTVVGPATITSFTPASGLADTSVTISGTSFTEVMAVTFNGSTAAFTVVSDTTIQATVPEGATTGPLSVTTPAGSATSATPFTVVGPPTIASFTPTSGPVGTNVTISGTYFTGATAVTFNGTAATFTVVSDTTIQATAPAEAATGPLGVTTPAGAATSATPFWRITSQPPGPASPVSPSGSMSTTTPAFSWTADGTATYYALSVSDASAGSPTVNWFTPSEAGCPLGGACTVAAPRSLASGLVSWAVITWNSFGYGPWSPTKTAVVDVADPAVPTPVHGGPSGSIATRTPTYTWDAVSGATWYQFSVTDALAVVREFWYSPSQACISTACAVTPNVLLAAGPAQWEVRAWRTSGAGAWPAAPVAFDAFDATDSAPGAATLVSPLSPVTTVAPSFTWNAVIGTAYYLLRVTDRDNVTIDRWYLPAAMGCPLGAGICAASPGIPLKAGVVTWRVLTWNASGYGPWSETREFPVEIADPAAPTPDALGPTGAIVSTNVPYRWTAVAGAISYRLSIRNNGNAPISWWYTAAAAGCDATGECHAVPQVALINGTAQWQVQAWTNTGYSQWSPVISVTVDIPAPPAPTLVSPDGASGTTSPMFLWNASARAMLYYIRAYDSTGLRIDRWLTPSVVGCASGGVCTLNSGVILTSGAGSWQVIAWNPSSYSPWSSSYAFVVP